MILQFLLLFLLSNLSTVHPYAHGFRESEYFLEAELNQQALEYLKVQNKREFQVKVDVRKRGESAAVTKPDGAPGGEPSLTVALYQEEETPIFRSRPRDVGKPGDLLAVTSLPVDELAGVRDEGRKYEVRNGRLNRDPYVGISLKPLYPGLGNHEVVLDVEEAALKNLMETQEARYGLERVGVVMIGIDGLRQDVLYPAAEQQVGASESSALYTNPRDLLGIGQVLGGRVATDLIEFSADPLEPVTIPVTSLTGEIDSRHIRLGNVTAVFPSITLASWASIFSGKMPGETGELGNEFFDRKLAMGSEPGIPAVKAKVVNPPGVISYSSGSFPGYDTWTHWDHILCGVFGKGCWDFVPMTEDIEAGVDPMVSPQNRLLDAEKAPLVYRFFKEWSERSLVQSSHYSRDADLWLTQTRGTGWESLWASLTSGDYFAGGVGSGVMDRVAKTTLRKWLDAHKEALLDGKERFPGVVVFYLGGVDHTAHMEGMGKYKEALEKIADPGAIAPFVDKLKEVGQFYNKVFLITSDHGHTEMATNLTYRDKNWLGMETDYPADTDCSYKVNFVDPKKPEHVKSALKAELANNNLHVWELGNLLTQFAKPEETGLLLLAPKGLENTGIKFTTDVNAATVVAALNGPMAHIYVKGASWQDDPDPRRLNSLVERLRTMLALGGGALDPRDYEDLKKVIPRLMGSVEAILVRTSRGLDYTVVVDTAEDADGNVTLLESPVDGYFDSTRFVKAAQRIQGMNHPDRSGDIILLMKSGSNDPLEDRYTSGVSCKSWHGSLNRSDSYVPLILSYPGGNAAELDKPIEEVCPGKQCDGNWKATDLIKKIIETQYSGQ